MHVIQAKAKYMRDVSLSIMAGKISVWILWKLATDRPETASLLYLRK